MAEVLQERQSAEEVFKWLRAQAQVQGLQATIYSELAEEKGRFLIVPVHLAETSDIYDSAAALQNLENAYTDQEPKPDWLLILRPAAAPRP